VSDLYDRGHVDSVLARVGVAKSQRDTILAAVQFPISLEKLQAILAPFGLSHDSLIDRMGGSP
jgi:hypothetical protein